MVNVIKRGIRKKSFEESVAFTHPHLLAEWNYKKNDILPTEVGKASTYPVHFICPKGHEFSTPLKYRTSLKAHGCNVCSGHVIISGVNDLKTLFPQVAVEMDRADNGGIKSHQVGAKVGKRFNFVCDSGHVWESRIDNRTSTGGKCPYCANQRVLPGFNDLQSQYPEIAAKFDVVKNGIKPDQIISKTNKKYFMICDNGHSYDVALQTLVRLGVQCAYCLNRKAWPGFNDLETKFPEIAKEFSIDLNGGTLPSEVVAGSHAKYWFTCYQGHSWKAVIANRTNRGDECSECSGASSSTVERAYHKAFMKSKVIKVSNERSNFTIDVPWRKHQNMRVDILGKVLPAKQQIVIEYDGSYWHSFNYSVQRDVDKTKALLEAGFLVVRIREGKLPHLELTDDKLYQINANCGSYKKDLAETIGKIEEWVISQKNLLG